MSVTLKSVYALGQALRAIRQHFTSTLATFTTALVSFTLLFLLGLVLWNLDRVVASLERDLEIAAFLDPEASSEALLSQIQAWSEVSEVVLQSKDQALAALQLDYPYLAQAQELVDNPLPDTLRLKLQSPGQVVEIAQRLERLEGIEAVTYGGEVTERIIRVLDGTRIAANLLIFLLILNTLFSVMGTIRLSIENRRDELKVMMLVGATRGFAQAPFIWEGLLLTLAAGVVALGAGVLAYGFVSDSLQTLLPFLPVLASSDLLQAGGALLVLAILLGWLGAFLSSRIHLKETQ